MTEVFVQNFGCRASQADGAAIESLLAREGYLPASNYQAADTIILNTCTVTAAADDEVRHTIRRIHRENPDAKIVVTGCYAQRAPQELIDLEGVSMVVGNSHKDELVRLMSAPYHGQIHASDLFSAKEFFAAPVEAALQERSRPNLKIQDGCNNRCSFCVIPSVRGSSRSAPVAQIVAQLQDLAQRYPEVILTGINLGRWGRDTGMQMRLANLLRLLLRETDIRRLRLSSVEPMDWSDDLLELVASSPRIAKHVHAPLQSGSDTILRRMHRKYRPRHYENRLSRARQLMPTAALGADVLAGFPGETEAEFNETLRFVTALPLTYLHVFPYSERPGTKAAAMDSQVPWPIRKQRVRALTELSQQKNLEFCRSMVGSVVSAVTLRGNEAMTSNFITVALATNRPPRQMIDLKLGDPNGSRMREHADFPIL